LEDDIVDFDDIRVIQELMDSQFLFEIAKFTSFGEHNTGYDFAGIMIAGCAILDFNADARGTAAKSADIGISAKGPRKANRNSTCCGAVNSFHV
jgi:hypothetical protein